MNQHLYLTSHKPQVVVKLVGGLGNQLFQYFFALSLARAFNADIFFDDSFFTSATKMHERERLSELGLPWKGIANSDIDFPFLYQNRFLKRLPFPRSFAYIREFKHLHYQSIQECNKDIYFDGFWQSYKYLEPIEAELCDCLNLSLDKYQTGDIALKVHSTESVSVHIRRGDYVSSKNHHALDISYYQQAIALIKSRIHNPIFYIFSDDISWVKKSLDFGLSPAIFASADAGVGDLSDLSLMRKCRNHIIANSTFSWWGAWLSWSQNHGVVIAPKYWTQTSSVSSDLCPKEWTLI